MQMKACHLLLVALLAVPAAAQETGSRIPAPASAPSPAAVIVAVPGGVDLRAGILQRSIRSAKGNLRTESLSVSGRDLLAMPGNDVSFTLSRADPNQRPVGLKPDAQPPIDSKTLRHRMLDSGLYEDRRPDAVRWTAAKRLESRLWGGKTAHEITRPRPGVTRLTVHAAPGGTDLAVDVCYELYDGHPAIRKWVQISNRGPAWLRIDHLALDDIRLTGGFRHRTPLTDAGNGAGSSVVAYHDSEGTAGVIAASEIPSALRHIDENGAQGYRDDLFEWVLGPGEQFVSERVFHYAYAGERRRTVSAVSTPLDRAVEGPYMRFLRQVIGIAADGAPLYAPQWLTFGTFGNTIDAGIVQSSADLVARAGFRQMLIDAGWQKGLLGTDPHPQRFPDFAATSQAIRSKGLSLGLWVASFRDLDSRDLAAMPDARSLPAVIQSESRPGLAMSFTTPWRHFYAQDLVALARRYHVTYFKQDLSNIMFGDFAEGHPSRTRKESLLRGLRGLFEAQDEIRRLAPELVTEITHEVYWGTPGPPADLAVLQHAAQYHIPPNEARGDTRRGGAPRSAAAHRADLLSGCWLARRLFFANRGLPLYPLEFYAAVTLSLQGSLTPEIQDRQVASWLMGAPLTFSGDLRTLSEQNIAHYRRRFDALAQLQERYDIYRHFQFSGVPQPTETGWHWWGKLNDRGLGAVVVLRGSAGADRQAVNIPWVDALRAFRVRGVFSGRDYGQWTGRQLRDGALVLTLSALGQEILELAPPR